VTHRLVFVTKVLALPSRQTALVANLAAEVDVLTGGRLRLGVGVGWNSVDFVAMGQDFHMRGRRIEEQIAVLRLLWTCSCRTASPTGTSLSGRPSHGSGREVL